MIQELDLEHLDCAPAGDELSDAHLESVVGGKGLPIGVSFGGYPGYGYGGYGGGFGGYRGFGGYGRGWW